MVDKLLLSPLESSEVLRHSGTQCAVKPNGRERMFTCTSAVSRVQGEYSYYNHTHVRLLESKFFCLFICSPLRVSLVPLYAYFLLLLCTSTAEEDINSESG